MRDVFEAASGSRGYRYVTHEPRSGDDPARVSEKVVRALMREEGLVVAYARKRARYSSYRGEISEAPENLVGRRFAADAPNRLWLTDITEFGLLGGKVYLSPIMDCFDGGLPAWSIGTSPDTRLANDSLKAVCGTPGRGTRVPSSTRTGGTTTGGPAGSGSARGTTWSDRCRRRTACPTTRRWRGSSGGSRTSSSTTGTGRGVAVPEFCRMLDAHLRCYNERKPKEGLG